MLPIPVFVVICLVFILTAARNNRSRKMYDEEEYYADHDRYFIEDISEAELLEDEIDECCRDYPVDEGIDIGDLDAEWVKQNLPKNIDYIKLLSVINIADKKYFLCEQINDGYDEDFFRFDAYNNKSIAKDLIFMLSREADDFGDEIRNQLEKFRSGLDENGKAIKIFSQEYWTHMIIAQKGNQGLNYYIASIKLQSNNELIWSKWPICRGELFFAKAENNTHFILPAPQIPFNY